MKTIVESEFLTLVLADILVFGRGRDDLLIHLHPHLEYLSKQPSSSEHWHKAFPFAVHSMQFLLRFRKEGEKIEIIAEQFPHPYMSGFDC